MNHAAAPRILIIIVTWNKREHVLDLLASLDSLNYPRAALDVVVVDNASEDGTVAALRERYPALRVLCNEENLGGTGGFNTGLAWAFAQPPGRYDYLWLLDNDVLVHRDALRELVAVLEQQADIGVVGSTMLQLDYPHRINEMGAYLERGLGRLQLHRHLQTIPAWQGVPVQQLLQTDPRLDRRLDDCPPYLDVDYVAAASLLIRAEVARAAGLWRDYFIHFDDVEWCLRIRGQSQRVAVSARSLIWHVSAIAKVPTWVLYYDNRNVLDLLQTHGASAAQLHGLKTYILKKAVYYHLMGKADLGALHQQAVSDFEQGRLGKRELSLDAPYRPHDELSAALQAPGVRRVLLSWTLNPAALGIQEPLVRAELGAQHCQIDCLILSGTSAPYPLPAPRLLPLSRFLPRRGWQYWRLRKRYDLVLQSDYAVVPLLSWLAPETLFINQDGYCRRPRPRWQAVWRAGWRWLRARVARTS